MEQNLTDTLYNFLVEHNQNSIIDDLEYEQFENLTFDNRPLINNIASYIHMFRETKNTGYIDLMVIIAIHNGFKLTGTIERAIGEAAYLRIYDKDRGGIKQIKQANVKEQALFLMFKLQHFLDMNKTQASEVASFFFFNMYGEAKVKASSLYHAYNKFIKNNSTIEHIKNWSKDDYEKTKISWQENIKQFPSPPDGHEVLGW